MRKGLTQTELAKLAGTHQPAIARLEDGEDLPSLSFLRRVVEAMEGRLEVIISE
ncbi:MAG: helix-turn-helix domain-containing protein [Anaerolineaceae bacterium]